MSEAKIYSVIPTPPLYDDLDRIFKFYDAIGLALSRRIRRLIWEHIESLNIFPYRNPRMPAADHSDKREAYVPFGKDGFIVRYEIDEDRMEVVIYRVHHTREDRYRDGL